MLIKGGLPDRLPLDPMPTLKAWHDEGLARKLVPNPNAMVVASVDHEGRPSARVVLCRNVECEQPALVFYTNYESRKGRELLGTNRVAAVLHWDHAERQARVEGTIEKMTDAESDTYFQSRELLKRIGAWSSHQSQPLASRQDLIEQTLEVMKRFGVSITDALAGTSRAHIPRPPHWGGLRIRPTSVELWAGGQGRLHDRAVWTRTGNHWNPPQRLQP